jgi:hypothetical protein
LTQKWVANAKVGKSDCERTSAGTRGNDEDAQRGSSSYRALLQIVRSMAYHRRRIFACYRDAEMG